VYYNVLAGAAPQSKDTAETIGPARPGGSIERSIRGEDERASRLRIDWRRKRSKRFKTGSGLRETD
jgi:hypothetical protein